MTPLMSPKQVQALFPENRRPYTVKSLAERWDCSEEHIRKLVRSGKLPAFSLGGKLIRIAVEDVGLWEKARNLSGTGESLPSASLRQDADSGALSEQMTSPPRGNAWRTISRQKPQASTEKR